MARVQITVWGFRCERCNHEWAPRGQVEPRVCPRCKSPYWNRPKGIRTLADAREGEEVGGL